MQTLAEQWRKRDREREALVKKKVGLLIQQTAAHSTFDSPTFFFFLEMYDCIVQLNLKLN